VGLGGELARLRIEIRRQVVLRRKAEEELAAERGVLMAEFTKKWDAFQSEIGQQVRSFENLKSEAENEWRKLRSEAASLQQRELSLLDVRTALAEWGHVSGACPTCGRSQAVPGGR